MVGGGRNICAFTGKLFATVTGCNFNLIYDIGALLNRLI